MERNHEAYQRGSYLSMVEVSQQLTSSHTQAEHLSFPLQAETQGKVSNLELAAKFKVGASCLSLKIGSPAPF